MKNKIRISNVIILFLAIFLIHSCKKDKLATPTVITVDVTDISQTTAISGGNVTSDGVSPSVTRGVCWSISENPTIADNKTVESGGLGAFTCNLTYLNPNTLYYVRAYAASSVGTGYGNQVSFTTNHIDVPILTTTEITSITQKTAISGGTIISDGASSITSRGICWSTNQNPTIANSKSIDETGLGTFISLLAGLTDSTTYYLRAYATNSVGTGYGNEKSFTTQTQSIFNPNLIYGTVTDFESNIYRTITIGSQTWMAENLKSTKYSDGTAIPLVTDNTAWINLVTPGYCWYRNDSLTNKNIYGGLYNYYAVNTDKLCPLGWHVPTEEEWITLITYLGGEDVAGGKLKETTTDHWNSPNFGATNETGFTGLPGGSRQYDGTTNFIGHDGNWWSSTEILSNKGFFIRLNAGYKDIGEYSEFKIYGFSVRCLKD